MLLLVRLFAYQSKSYGEDNGYGGGLSYQEINTHDGKRIGTMAWQMMGVSHDAIQSELAVCITESVNKTTQ